MGERTVRLPEIFRAMARFSPSAPSGHLPRRGRFFDTLGMPRMRHPFCVLKERIVGASTPFSTIQGRPLAAPGLSRKVCSPLGPLCEGAPPAGGGGENCTAARNISGYGKVLSLRPFGAPPSQREVFRHAGDAANAASLLRFERAHCVSYHHSDNRAAIGRPWGIVEKGVSPASRGTSARGLRECPQAVGRELYGFARERYFGLWRWGRELFLFRASSSSAFGAPPSQREVFDTLGMRMRHPFWCFERA